MKLPEVLIEAMTGELSKANLVGNEPITNGTTSKNGNEAYHPSGWPNKRRHFPFAKKSASEIKHPKNTPPFVDRSNYPAVGPGSKSSDRPAPKQGEPWYNRHQQRINRRP